MHTIEVDCRTLQLGVNVYGRTVTHVAAGSAAEELIKVRALMPNLCLDDE